MSDKKTSIRRFATISLLAPAGALALAAASRLLISMTDGQVGIYLGLAVGIGQAIILLVGLVLGIVALCQVKKVGKEGVFLKAVLGVFACAFLLIVPPFVFYYMSSSLREKMFEAEMELQQIGIENEALESP